MANPCPLDVQISIALRVPPAFSQGPGFQSDKYSAISWGKMLVVPSLFLLKNHQWHYQVDVVVLTVSYYFLHTWYHRGGKQRTSNMTQQRSKNMKHNIYTLEMNPIYMHRINNLTHG